MRRIIGLCLLCAAGLVSAEAPSEDGLVFGVLQAGPPIRQGYAYQLQVELSVSNSDSRTSAESELFFVYTTITGERYACLNQTLPARHPGIFSLPGLLPGARQSLSGTLLIPTGWYRGKGTLGVGRAGLAEAEVEVVLY
jgi:hypothetical protein